MHHFARALPAPCCCHVVCQRHASPVSNISVPASHWLTSSLLQFNLPSKIFVQICRVPITWPKHWSYLFIEYGVVVCAGLLTFVLEQEVVASHVIMVIVKSDDAM